jgi:hypothetical protein
VQPAQVQCWGFAGVELGADDVVAGQNGQVHQAEMVACDLGWTALVGALDLHGLYLCHDHPGEIVVAGTEVVAVDEVALS